MAQKLKALAQKLKKLTFTQISFSTVLGIVALLTVVSTILLAVQLADFVQVDDREVKLRSNLEKELELFSATYENASGQIVVSGADGQAVVAPGTGVEYTIRLRNTDKTAINYQLGVKIDFTTEFAVPIQVRMLDANDNYIIGDAKTWVDAAALDMTPWSAILLKNQSTEYYFQWRWRYDGDDEYDTFLGSYDGDIGLSVTMELYAEANTDIGTNGGVWASGLGIIIVLGCAAVALAASTGLMISILIKQNLFRPPAVPKLPRNRPLIKTKKPPEPQRRLRKKRDKAMKRPWNRWKAKRRKKV